MIKSHFDPTAHTGQIILQPNHSWSWRANVWFLGTLAAISIVIAASFLVQGYWLILPFTGLELLVLYAAIYWCVRKAHSQEVVRLTMDKVVVEKGMNQVEARHQFDRYFTRIHVEHTKGISATQRIAITERDRSLEIGAFLSDDEKTTLVSDLRSMINRLNNRTLA